MLNIRINVLGATCAGLLLGGSILLYSQVLTVAYPMVPADLRAAILPRLAQEGIWYREEREGVVRFFRSDRESVLRIGRVVSEEILPSSRSFAPAPQLLQDVIAGLKENGVPFETRLVESETWIILPEGQEHWKNEVLLKAGVRALESRR